MILSNIIKIIGYDLGNVIYDKLLNSNINLKDLPEKDIYNIVYATFNYIDSHKQLNYNHIQEINLNEIINIWETYLNEYKEQYKKRAYVETNKVILDYRMGGMGYYWVDLDKLFCIDSMIRMKDCGRVNYGNTTFELRETTNNESLSHVIIVYNLKDDLILQIKGQSNKLPNKKYWGFIYDFLLNYPKEINGYKPTYKPENDFKLEYLPTEKQKELMLKHPKLVLS